MTIAHQHALDELITHVRSGRIKRRTFLEGALALGLTSTAASSLLAACGGSSNSSGGNGSALNITWQCEHDNTGYLYQNLVDTFNKTNKAGIYVTLIDGPDNTDQQHTIFLNMLSTRSSSVDILSMDITWPAEFALNQWISPITDLWPTSERTHYLPGPIQGCTVGDQIWATPFRTDVGVLYYRTDAVFAPPRTWNDLTTYARSAQSKANTKYGYVWQGASYEGLVCDFIEVLYGYNGSVLDAHNPQLVTVNSPQAADALTMMVNWVNTISPTAVTHFVENDSLTSWLNGDAAFMRNWPYAYSLSNKNPSKIIDKFNISNVPSGNSATPGHGAVGGWQLGINAFSSPAKRDAAWQFIQYMLSIEPQKRIALDASNTPVLKSIYTDQEVLTKLPLFQKLAPILQNALPRPVSSRYPDISRAIQSRVHSALTKQSSVTAALTALANDLQFIVTL